MFIARSTCVVAALLSISTRVAAQSWRWPDQSIQEAVRIDNKVRFTDEPSDRPTRQDKNSNANVQSDEGVEHFSQADNTEGFYNRPGEAGRYPVRTEVPGNPVRYQVDGSGVYPAMHAHGLKRRPNHHGSDGTVDSFQYCKCVSSPICKPVEDVANACGPGRYLCCFNRDISEEEISSELFNEVGDQRPLLLTEDLIHGPLPPLASPRPHHSLNRYFAPGPSDQSVLVGPQGPTGTVGPTNRPSTNKGVLVGPGGPTGVIGPQGSKNINQQRNPGVLVGPDGPTGVIGPQFGDNYPRDVLIGPNEGGHPSASAQRGVLVGPDGPTGIIGPRGYNSRPGILVGPGGPTGQIGPRGYNAYNSRPGVLVGPGGPTGIIGPNGSFRQQRGRGILVGPGGPTGTIGPGRGLLVGPGGPTGIIGPRRSDIGRACRRKTEATTTESHFEHVTNETTKLYDHIALSIRRANLKLGNNCTRSPVSADVSYPRSLNNTKAL